MNIKAELAPLGGKYYGSDVIINSDDIRSEIRFWKTYGYPPSKRQLEYWGMSLEEATADLMMCDSHYESEYTYQLCMELIGRINSQNDAVILQK
jgi:hypothetical protein